MAFSQFAVAVRGDFWASLAVCQVWVAVCGTSLAVPGGSLAVRGGSWRFPGGSSGLFGLHKFMNCNGGLVVVYTVFDVPIRKAVHLGGSLAVPWRFLAVTWRFVAVPGGSLASANGCWF